MNSETRVADPELKFVKGVCKGQPLDSVGLDYKLTEYKGKQVALFRNGAIAEFYRDPAPPAPVLDLAEWNRQQTEKRTAFAKEFEAGQLGVITGTGFVPIAVAPPPAPIPAPQTFFSKLHERYFLRPRLTLAAYRDVRRRPLKATDPVYCLLENGQPTQDFLRYEVGTGVREYLWLYQKLRYLCRSRIRAAWEAQEIYFL